MYPCAVDLPDTATHSDAQHLGVSVVPVRDHGGGAPSRLLNVGALSGPQSVAAPSQYACAPHKSAPDTPDRAASESDEDDSTCQPPTPMNDASAQKRRNIDATNDAQSPARHSATPRPGETSSHPAPPRIAPAVLPVRASLYRGSASGSSQSREFSQTHSLGRGPDASSTVHNLCRHVN